jgi:hypothetical protein
MSNENKKKLKKFFEEKSGKIHLTQQIEKEFQKNRESTITDYFKTLNEIRINYESDLQKGVKSKFNNLLQSKIVEQDFPEIMASIKKIYEELDSKLFSNDSLMDKITSDVEKSLDDNKSLIFVDPILDVYSKFNRVPDLSDGELIYLSNKYDEYLLAYKEAKESVKERLSFPGCGELKNTDKNGDFIIFHEILKFMKENTTDAILLTRDVTKSDWLKKNRQPFIHYILKVYQLTGQILYIFDATDLLQIISFENIYKTDNTIDDDLDDDFQEQIDEDPHDFYRRRFFKIVNSVKDYFERVIAELINFSIITERSSLEQDLDLIGYLKTSKRLGVLVYQCGSTRKSFQRNVQKRINACNKSMACNLCDESILAIVVNKKSYLQRFNYDLLESDYNVRIVIFYCRDFNEPQLEVIDDRRINV